MNKEYILSKWASEGLTCRKVKEIIKSSGDISDFFIKSLTALSFGVPLVGGSLLYTLSHPEIIKQKQLEKRLKTFDETIAKVKGISPNEVDDYLIEKVKKDRERRLPNGA